MSDYQFQGLVRKFDGGRGGPINEPTEIFRRSPCCDPEHEPWALVAYILDIPSGVQGGIQPIGKFFITDGINVIAVKPSGARIGFIPTADIPTADEKEAVFKAFAKGFEDV